MTNNVGDRLAEICVDAAEEIVALRKTVLAYNAALRSAYQVADRLGAGTDWMRFHTRLKKVLDDNHATFVLANGAVPKYEPKPGEIGGAVAP